MRSKAMWGDPDPLEATKARSVSRSIWNALAGHCRLPGAPMFGKEVDWLATGDERVVGVLVLDSIDKDYGWVVLRRDEETGSYEVTGLNVSFPTWDEARAALVANMEQPAIGEEG
jgi:hypothetical protein